jgi:hypothetical protein
MTGGYIEGLDATAGSQYRTDLISIKEERHVIAALTANGPVLAA